MNTTITEQAARAVGEYFTDTGLPNIIEIRDVTQRYGDVTIIKGLNFLVEGYSGKTIGVLGTSGAGKSTMLRYLAGLQRPTEGSVFISDVEQAGQIPVAMVFQKYSSFPWLTVLENVALGLKLKGVPKKDREEWAMKMIDFVRLTGHEHKYAQYPILSGGQLQRVAIARSLIVDPPLILMDEPFGALDVKTRGRLQLRVTKTREILPNTSIVFVTHSIEEAVFVSDEVWIMGGKPAKITDRIPVDIPFPRDIALKRDTAFIQMCHRIEDRMLELEPDDEVTQPAS